MHRSRMNGLDAVTIRIGLPDTQTGRAAEALGLPRIMPSRSTLHLIDEDLALRFLEAGEIKRFRTALASKPNDVFFLCMIPTQNLDNSWNDTNLDGCDKAKALWTKAISRKGEGAENYKINFAKEPQAFSDPKWPTQSLGELIVRAFAGRMIETEDHPALLRKIGAKQSLS